MSHPYQNHNVPNPEIGVDQYSPQYPPQSAQNQAPRGMSNFADSSGQIFSMYLDMATEEDKRMVENWKADADGILIFTGLFSAAVATLISVSIQDIRQNPQDTSNFYLANIHQTLADPNRSTTSSIPSSSPPPFSPPNHAEGEARPAVHTATTDLLSQLPSPPPGTDTVTDGPSTHSLGTEHIEHRLPDAIVVEQTGVGQTPSSDIGVPSSPSPTLVLGDFHPIDSHSQMLAPAASGPSRPWDPNAAVEGEESFEAALCQGEGKDKPHDDITVTSDVPTRLLSPQPIAIAGVSRTSSRGSLDTSKYPSRPHGQYDIV